MNNSVLANELHGYLEQNGQNMSSFAERCGINCGTISGLLSRSRPLAVSHLDIITQTMGLPRGHFYESYVNDFIFNYSVNWRRINPIVVRCAELGMISLIEKIVSQALDNLNYLDNFYDLAENFFEKGEYAAAKVLYIAVSSSEKSAHSERLATCHYRLFQIARKNNIQSNELINLLPYISKLPENLMVMSLLDVCESLYMISKWDDLLIYSSKLQELSLKFDRNGLVDRSVLNKPLIYYYGHGILLESAVHLNKNDIVKAEECADKYGRLDLYFEVKTDEDQRYVLKFGVYANANLKWMEVKKGNQDMIPEYVELLKANKDEVLDGLVNLLDSANTYKYNIDHVLNEFTEDISDFNKFNGNTGSDYREEVTLHRYALFCQKYALYCLNNGSYSEGIDSALQSLKISIIIRNKDISLRTMSLIKVNEVHASENQYNIFNNLCRRVLENDEEEVVPIVNLVT